MKRRGGWEEGNAAKTARVVRAAKIVRAANTTGRFVYKWNLARPEVVNGIHCIYFIITYVYNILE
eukprot:scaffold76854_cov54-Attheya_sp.AAC.1